MGWKELGIAVAVPLCGGILSGLLGSRAEIRSWYQYLRKPKWAPAPWVFGPVWTTLYMSMGYASYLVYSSPSPQKNLPLTLYGCHLLLNFAWTPIFFRFKAMRLALVDLSLIWASVATLIGLYWPINPLASALMAPYMAWLTLAWALNYSVWQMNRCVPLENPVRGFSHTPSKQA